MSLEAILETIRASGKARVDEVEERADRQAHQARVNARLEADRLEEESYAAASTPAIRERARILHRARLEALQITGNALEVLVDAAMDQAHGRLVGIRTDSAYADILRRLTQEALAELDSTLGGVGGVQLEADPRDRALVERILSDLGLELEVSYHLECWGGIIASSRDGQVLVINTPEARLERAAPYLRRYLAAFFEQNLSKAGAIHVLQNTPMV
ncbi:MAG: V-type ATP synthase subunit E [Anaerolineales bacterium]|nr:V-type ATP synthase subunit E [Anaerolineales bacterium]